MYRLYRLLEGQASHQDNFAEERTEVRRALAHPPTAHRERIQHSLRIPFYQSNFPQYAGAESDELVLHVDVRLKSIHSIERYYNFERNNDVKHTINES